MSDRKEREEHIKRLEAALACEEKQSSGKCSKQTCDDNCALLYEQGNWGEWKETLRYAINSLKTDLKYDLLYEETIEQSDKPITKNCESCRYYGSHHKVCNYCYKCSLWTEQESTNKNDLGVDCISRNTVLTLINDVKNANGFSKYTQYEYLFDQVDTMPPVTPIRPKGHWIWCVGSHKCSNCEEYTCFSHKELLRYCPNCGADMRTSEE